MNFELTPEIVIMLIANVVTVVSIIVSNRLNVKNLADTVNEMKAQFNSLTETVTNIRIKLGE